MDESQLEVLLRKISQGSLDAFRIFYDNYYSLINRFTSYFISSNESREEIVSDVFLSIWQNQKKLIDIKNFNSFLYTMIHNRSIDYIKKNKDTVSIDTITLGIKSEDHSPEEQLTNKELNQRIQLAVESLPERSKLIFLMAKEEGLKYKDIAKILDISEKTVNAQMVIALKKLRDALSDI